ncbi:MAG TPA: hypothetical protein VJK02_19510 [Anaerolineales bacterium]|nr:hypothetical protein [Anaerolineales bacterium]
MVLREHPDPSTALGFASLRSLACGLGRQDEVKRGTDHLRQVILHLLRGKSEYPVAPLLEPLTARRVVARLVRRDMAVPVDLDDQVRLGTRAGRYKTMNVSAGGSRG